MKMNNIKILEMGILSLVLHFVDGQQYYCR